MGKGDGISDDGEDDTEAEAEVETGLETRVVVEAGAMVGDGNNDAEFCTAETACPDTVFSAGFIGVGGELNTGGWAGIPVMDVT